MSLTLITQLSVSDSQSSCEKFVQDIKIHEARSVNTPVNSRRCAMVLAVFINLKETEHGPEA